VLSKAGTLMLYRAASDARTAAERHGADSAEALLAHETLLCAIDAMSDDGGGQTYRRIAAAERRGTPTVGAELQTAPPTARPIRLAAPQDAG
jgi:hypothetical protein